MAHTPKLFQAIHVYFKKIEEASRWILYSSLLCLVNYPNIWWFIFYRLSKIIRVNLNWLRVTTTYFTRKNVEPGVRI